MRFAALIAVLAFPLYATGICAQPVKSVLVERIETAFAKQSERKMHLSPDSGVLAWGESPLLEICVWMYRATGDARWLDRFVEHADAVFSTAASVDEDKCHGWRTRRYSIARASATARPENRSRAQILPPSQDIWDVDMVAKVTGRQYRLWFPRPGRIVAHDMRTQRLVGTSDIEPGQEIALVPGVPLKLEGQPQAGDVFLVTTTAPLALRYVVHDGMILRPIAFFAGLVLNDPALSRYEPAARRYLDIIEGRLVHNWDARWRELEQGAGVYVAPDIWSQRFAGCTLPHNQYLAFARALLALHRATGKQWYRERAEKMGRFFKSNLRTVNDHYEWNYWDPAIARDAEGMRMQHREDTSHGHIDVGFAIDAYEAGLMFTREDMNRLARTLLHMWNGSADAPAFAAVVGGRDGKFTAMVDWIRLGAFDVRLRDVLARLVANWNDLDSAHALAAAQWLACESAGWPEAPK